MEEKELILNENYLEVGGDIKNLIHTIRGKQVILDYDVAMLYHYTTKRINEAVNRNKERFPESFCFKLTEDEFENMRSQFATASGNRLQEEKQKQITVCFYRTRYCNAFRNIKK